VGDWMEAERLEVEDCLVDGCLALKDCVDCLMEKRYCETGHKGCSYTYQNDRVLPETLVGDYNASRAHRIREVWQS